MAEEHHVLNRLKEIGHALKVEEHKIEDWWNRQNDRVKARLSVGATTGIIGSLVLAKLVAGIETGNVALIDGAFLDAQELEVAFGAGVAGLGGVWGISKYKEYLKKQEEKEKLKAVV